MEWDLVWDLVYAVWNSVCDSFSAVWDLVYAVWDSATKAGPRTTIFHHGPPRAIKGKPIQSAGCRAGIGKPILFTNADLSISSTGRRSGGPVSTSA